MTSSVCLYESKNSRSLIISKILSTSDVKDADFSLAPNPVDDLLFIKTKKTVTDYEIIDISGRVISKKSNIDNTINFRGLTKGTYVVKLFDNNSVIYQSKIIKK